MSPLGVCGVGVRVCWGEVGGEEEREGEWMGWGGRGGEGGDM